MEEKGWVENGEVWSAFFALAKSPACSRTKCCRAKAQLSSLHPSKGTGKTGPCSPAMGVSALSPLWRLLLVPSGFG